jgi:hypothetical protein
MIFHIKVWVTTRDVQHIATCHWSQYQLLAYTRTQPINISWFSVRGSPKCFSKWLEMGKWSTFRVEPDVIYFHQYGFPWKKRSVTECEKNWSIGHCELCMILGEDFGGLAQQTAALCQVTLVWKCWWFIFPITIHVFLHVVKKMPSTIPQIAINLSKWWP